MKIKRGEIYYADINSWCGSVQSGRRPVLIIQNNVGNMNSPTTIVTLLTSKDKKSDMLTHVPIMTMGLKTVSVAMLEQIQTIDKSMLQEYITRIDRKTMRQVDEAIKVSLGV